MDVTRVRVNLEEAIAAVQAVRVLKNLSIRDIDWYSNGVQVELVDYEDHTYELPSDLYVANYLEDFNFIITPIATTEEILEDE